MGQIKIIEKIASNLNIEYFETFPFQIASIKFQITKKIRFLYLKYNNNNKE